MYKARDEEKSMIMTWLWKSVEPNINGNYMLLPNAHEIWESTYQTYSKMQDASLLYEIKSKISFVKQGTRNVIDYYNLLKVFDLNWIIIIILR